MKLSIVKFCEKLKISRQYFYNKEEQIRNIIEVEEKISLGNLNLKEIKILITFFLENSRMKIKENGIKKFKEGNSYLLKDVLKRIGASHTTLTKFYKKENFLNLDLPFIKKIKSIDSSFVEIVKKELLNEDNFNVKKNFKKRKNEINDNEKENSLNNKKI